MLPLYGRTDGVLRWARRHLVARLVLLPALMLGGCLDAGGFDFVADAPAITQQPQDQGWHPGEGEALFVVEAQGDDLTYQWQASTDAGLTFTDVANATDRTYRHHGGIDDPVDAIRVKVSGRDATTTSRTAKLSRLDWRSMTLTRVDGQTLVDLAWVDETTVVAAGRESTILRSTDAGASWTTVSEEAGSTGEYQRIAMSTAGVGVAVGLQSVLRSMDAGQHWARIDPAAGLANGKGVAFGDASNVAVIDTDGRIAHSADAGRTWATTYAPPAEHAILNDIAMRPAGTGLAVGANGRVLRSTDFGRTWSPVPSGTDIEFYKVSFASDSVAYAARVDATLMRSSDAGRSWQTVNTNFAAGYAYSMAFRDPLHGVAIVNGDIETTEGGGQTWSEDLSRQSGDFWAVRYSPSSSRVLAAGASAAMRLSSDGGSTWDELGEPLPFFSILDIEFLTDSVGLAMSADGSILRTSDSGLDWQRIWPDLDNQVTWLDAAVANPRTAVAVGHKWGSAWIMRSTDSGQSWTPAVHDAWMPPLWGVAFASPTVGVAVGTDSFLRTTDGGASWVKSAGPAQGGRTIAFGSGSVGLVAGMDGQLYRTADGGLSWNLVNTGIERPEPNDIAFASPGVAIMVTGSTAGSILRSTDGGQTWSVVRPYASLRMLHHVRFATPLTGLAVGDYGAMARTDDGGLTWTYISVSTGVFHHALGIAGPHTALTVVNGATIRRNDRF